VIGTGTGTVSVIAIEIVIEIEIEIVTEIEIETEKEIVIGIEIATETGTGTGTVIEIGHVVRHRLKGQIVMSRADLHAVDQEVRIDIDAKGHANETAGEGGIGLGAPLDVTLRDAACLVAVRHLLDLLHEMTGMRGMTELGHHAAIGRGRESGKGIGIVSHAI
jgi:hypothetical protein